MRSLDARTAAIRLHLVQLERTWHDAKFEWSDSRSRSTEDRNINPIAADTRELVVQLDRAAGLADRALSRLRG